MKHSHARISGLALAAALAACSKSNEVELLLGPTDTTFSEGFLCRSRATNLPLLARAVEDNQLVFQLVIDVVDLQGKFPSCRGEELLAACRASPCPIAVSASPTRRYCERIAVPISMDGAELRRTIGEQLASRGKILADAPARPVMIRAVTTQQPCDEVALVKPEDPTQYVDLDPDRALGCAYSCPVQLDEISGSLSVSLDVLTPFCEDTVRACAAFPARLDQR